MERNEIDKFINKYVEVTLFNKKDFSYGKEYGRLYKHFDILLNCMTYVIETPKYHLVCIPDNIKDIKELNNEI